MMTSNVFPHFQPIRLDVKQILLAHVQRFPPYSDFNVWNMMGWANQERTAYTFLNDNLVIRGWDCYEDRDVYSLLGTNKIDDTLQELFQITACLELIPEIVVKNITDPRSVRIEEDPDNHDYILSTERLLKLSGNSLYSIRAEVHRFPHYFPDHTIRFLDFNNARDRQDVTGLTRSWCQRKGLSADGTEGILDGIASFMHYAPFFRAVSLGLYVGGRLAGFTINEMLDGDMAITHFGISDSNYEGSSRYVTHATAKLLHQNGYGYLNYEQDMGVPGLRNAKRAYRPVHLLKKYKISVTM